MSDRASVLIKSPVGETAEGTATIIRTLCKDGALIISETALVQILVPFITRYSGPADNISISGNTFSLSGETAVKIESGKREA